MGQRAEIRVDDGAARARAQRCLSDVRERKAEGKEIGSRGQQVVRVSPCLNARRVLSQSIHAHRLRHPSMHY